MTKEEFKDRWNSDTSGGGITYEDIADCAKEWNLYSRPKTMDIEFVLAEVLKAAGVQK